MLSGCTQDMADQPKQTPFTPSDFFANGSARHLVSGTVARGSVDEDVLDVPPTANTFPIPVTEDLLKRGQDRFDIYCSVCHGYTGEGDGTVVRRGFPQPPSYNTDQLRALPLGQFYDVITNGFGRMPSYGAQVSKRDRWAIIAYIRALQFSQNAPVSQLPPEDRGRISSASPGQPIQPSPSPGASQ
jgi:mono/diheme cytochrome c family protein